MHNTKRNLIIISIVLVAIAAIALSIVFSSKEKKKTPFYREVKEGDVITFGRYEQDNNLKNGPEDLEWIVLESSDSADSLVLLSKYCIDAQPLNSNGGEYYWADSSLRKWLNEDFYNTAFDEKDKEWIQRVRLENPDEIVLKAPGGRNTVDQVFLLGELEILKYFPEYSFNALSYSWEGVEDKLRIITSNDAHVDILKTTLTDYAREKYKVAYGESSYEDVEKEYGKGAAAWWLRTPGQELEILNGLQIRESGMAYAGNGGQAYGVRPVICISRNKKPKNETSDIAGEKELAELLVSGTKEDEVDSTETTSVNLKNMVSALQQEFLISDAGDVMSFSYTWHPDTWEWKGVEKVYSDYGIVLGIDQNGKIVYYNDPRGNYEDSIGEQIDLINESVDTADSAVKDIAIVKEAHQFFALLDVGMVVQFDDKKMSYFTDLRDVVAISAMKSGVFFLKEDGTVQGVTNKTWVDSEVASWSDICEICTGECFVAGLKSDGTVVACGAYLPVDYQDRNTIGDLSSWNNIKSISAGYNHLVGLKKDGTVVASGINNYGQCDVEQMKNIERIDASGNLTIGYNKKDEICVSGRQILKEYLANTNELQNYDISWGFH